MQTKVKVNYKLLSQYQYVMLLKLQRNYEGKSDSYMTIKQGSSHDKPLLILQTNPFPSYNICGLCWIHKEISSLEPTYCFVTTFTARNIEL